MDRNTFTGLFLILVILVGSTFLMQPSESEINREKQLQDSAKNTSAAKPQPAALQAQPQVITPDSATLKGPFGASAMGSAENVTLENEQLKVTISTRGAGVSRVELKNYKTYDGKPVVLLNEQSSRFGLAFDNAGRRIHTGNLFFQPSTRQVKVSGKDSSSVTLRLNHQDGQYLDFVYSIRGDSFNIGLNIISNGLQQVFGNRKTLQLNWDAVLDQKEKDLTSEKRYSTAYFKPVDDDVDHLDLAESEKKALNEQRIKWISFKQHFFSNVLIAEKGFESGELEVRTTEQANQVKAFSADMQLAYDPAQAVQNHQLSFYFGPNKFNILKAQGHEIERQIDLGWGPLKWINRFAVLPVFNFLEGLNWNYGLIIIILTIILKLVLFPLTYKSYLSMAKMRVLKPEMEEIKAKVGDDNPTLLQQEYMKLYKKAGVNPLGGCLPMLLQLPIIMAFFFFFPNLFEIRQESFLWMDDLSTYDAFFNLGFTIPFLGSHISLMCLLMTASTLVYTYFNNQISGVTGQMKYIGYITPIIFFGVLNSYPAGLNYYYFCANVITFGQQFFIRQMVDDSKIHAQIQENKKKPGAEKKSKFQQRMEDYMRQQQNKANQKQQTKKK